MPIDRISEKAFETAGLIVGSSASVMIVIQIVNKLHTKTPSTLSPLYVTGFFGIFSFWVLYGLRFRRTAITITNTAAALLQGVLLAITLFK
ncbi:MAG: hypothetical protein ABIF71_07080 [Planctomycetota bacterium]